VGNDDLYTMNKRRREKSNGRYGLHFNNWGCFHTLDHT